MPAVAAVRKGWRALTSAERRSMAGIAAFIAALHIIGWGVLVMIVAPRQYSVGGHIEDRWNADLQPSASANTPA